MTEMEPHEFYMRHALELAERAYSLGETPVGAVIVRDKTGEIVGEGYNLRESEKSPLAHAEIIAIDRASKTLGGWRLVGCTLYVTLEPCPMCAGAIINSRIPRVVFGARDPKSGAFGSVLDLNQLPLNHKPEIITGVLEDECSEIMSRFFKTLREKKQGSLRSASAKPPRV